MDRCAVSARLGGLAICQKIGAPKSAFLSKAMQKCRCKLMRLHPRKMILTNSIKPISKHNTLKQVS